MSNTMQHPQKPDSQSGMVSIMVTMVLMVVLSLIVLGFAQVARRNQREVLDRQLSTQAFYAAESGVNDVIDLIKNAATTAIPAKPDCTNGSDPSEATFYGTLPAKSKLDTANNVSYTCVMVDPNPTSLVKSIDSQGTVMPLISGNGSINTLTFTWRSADATNQNPQSGCPTSTSKVFSSANAWASSNCGYGVLRFDLVPTSGNLTQGGLQSSTMSTFVVPVNGGSGAASVPFSPTGSQDLVGTTCTKDSCTMTITGLSSSQYDLRVLSLYNPVSFQVTGNGGTTSFQGAQAVIDATGKAQDVLRRIQVRVPLTASSTNLTSDYAIQSTDSVCKRFGIMDGYFKNDASNVVPNMESQSPSNPANPLCND